MLETETVHFGRVYMCRLCVRDMLTALEKAEGGELEGNA
jgi:hypothetical protein